MNKKPIGNFVMLKEYHTEDQKSDGGIILPDATVNKKEFYEVVKLGTGQVDENGNMMPFQVDVGDIVIISTEKPATTVSWEGEKVLIIHQYEIIAKVLL